MPSREINNPPYIYLYWVKPPIKPFKPTFAVIRLAVARPPKRNITPRTEYTIFKHCYNITCLLVQVAAMARPRTITDQQRAQVLDLKRRYSFAQVATITGLPLGTVRTLIRRKRLAAIQVQADD